MRYTFKDITLRDTRTEDLDFVIPAEQSKENAPYVAQWSREAHLKAFEDEDVLHVIIETEGRRVGYAIMAGLKEPNKCIELKRVVVIEKGKGLGRRAMELFIKLAFEELAAHRLWLDVREYNQRAIHLYDSLGFVREGLIRECIWTGDKFVSHYIMSILEQEYKGNT
jgi:diamine N-acetyltransferase